MRKHAICVALLTLLPYAAVARADDVRTIRVTGEGSASAAPDLATVQTGVVTQSANAKDALAANNKAMESILSAVKSHRVAAKDVQTSQFNVHPVYKHDAQGRTQPEIVAYQVTNQIQVRVRKLANLGEVLDALVQAGSNQVSGVSLSLADPTPILDEARTRAIADAKRRAQLYAKAAGVRVGKVQTIDEQTARRPAPHPLGRQVAVEMAAAVPVATGEDEYRVTVDVVFVLEDAK